MVSQESRDSGRSRQNRVMFRDIYSEEVAAPAAAAAAAAPAEAAKAPVAAP